MTNTFTGGKLQNASKYVLKIPSLVHNKANVYFNYNKIALIIYHVAQSTV